MASSRLIAFLLLLFTAVQAHAQQGNQSSALGLLFTTPEERAYLDYLREDFLQRTASEGFDIQTEEIPEIEPEAPEQNVEFYLNAIITNQDGSHTIWLNGAPVRELDLPGEVRLVHRSGRDMLQIATSSATYLLKPGQTVNLSTGELWESFEARLNNTGAAGEESTNSNGAQNNVSQAQSNGAPAQSTGQATNPQASASTAPPFPSSTSSSAQGQGVVAIQDLIEALQMIQSGGNEETSDTSQQ